MSTRRMIEAIGRDMAHIYAENKKNGMTTAEGNFILCGYDILIECLPRSVMVEIHKNGRVVNRLPNIENTIQNKIKKIQL